MAEMAGQARRRPGEKERGAAARLGIEIGVFVRNVSVSCKKKGKGEGLGRNARRDKLTSATNEACVH